MTDELTIGKVANMTGVPARTIRFYEDESLLPRPGRSASGYRLYSAGDITRLRFIRGARLLGIDLSTIKSLLDRAFDESCAVFGEELDGILTAQIAEVEQRLTELEEVRTQLIHLREHVAHCCEGCEPDQRASECDYCDLLITEKGGDKNA